MLLTEVLNRLDKVSQHGEQYTALCPAHDDKNPSLAVTVKDDKILVYCQAGCTTQDIVGSMGLQLKDLFTESNLSPLQRQQYRHKKTVRQCLEILEIEIHIFYQCIVQLLHTDTPLSDEERARYLVAQTRIIKLIGLLNDARRI